LLAVPIDPYGSYLFPFPTPSFARTCLLSVRHDLYSKDDSLCSEMLVSSYKTTTSRHNPENITESCMIFIEH
jgi:hypothetical protein